MFSTPQYIAKGFYTHSQIDQFICVKDYFFTQKGDQKYLLLRFANSSDFTANSMAFTLIQLDCNGAVLEKTPIEYYGLNFISGSTHVPQEGIPINEFCTDFKVQFSLVTSGHYAYQVNGSQVTVRYTPTNTAGGPAVERTRTIFSLNIHPLKHGKQGLSILCGICVLLLLMGICIYRMYDNYRDATEEETQNPLVSTTANFSPFERLQ